ncbi:MAG TPA: TIGR03435 family protein [Bryobacteraceae bacterium]|jgi:uncharacterized protein (TIGR03435 family)|nr:TIGR03435 family protein [Bryobacteraceae bacterium]
MRFAIAAGILFIFSCSAAAQTGAPPAFEVASVRAAPVGGKGGGRGDFGFGSRGVINSEPGSLTMRNVNMSTAIGWAYGVKEFQVVGPAWLASERYTIAAKAADAAPEDRLRLMLRTLLADRFKLAAHQEEKVMPYYLLTVAKGGPKFKESETEGEPDLQPGRGMTTATLTHMPISRLVEMLETMLRAPVVDETGLKGRYDATLNIAQYASSPVQMDDIPSFLAGAVQDLLGLKLEPKKGPVQVVVVDHAEKAPTEN